MEKRRVKRLMTIRMKKTMSHRHSDDLLLHHRLILLLSGMGVDQCEVST